MGEARSGASLRVAPSGSAIHWTWHGSPAGSRACALPTAGRGSVASQPLRWPAWCAAPLRACRRSAPLILPSAAAADLSRHAAHLLVCDPAVEAQQPVGRFKCQGRVGGARVQQHLRLLAGRAGRREQPGTELAGPSGGEPRALAWPALGGLPADNGTGGVGQAGAALAWRRQQQRQWPPAACRSGHVQVCGELLHRTQPCVREACGSRTRSPFAMGRVATTSNQPSVQLQQGTGKQSSSVAPARVDSCGLTPAGWQNAWAAARPKRQPGSR